MDPLHLITFDLELRKSVEAVGGWENAKKGHAGVSILVAHDSQTDRDYFYDEHTLSDFAHLVEQSGVVLVGYNSMHFDLPVVQSILERKLLVRYHIDLYDYIKNALSDLNRTRQRGWKLGGVALRTMGIDKAGSGERAPDLAALGRWAELIEYCRADVDLTRQLADYARRHGGVLDNDGTILPLALPEWFRLPCTVPMEV